MIESYLCSEPEPGVLDISPEQAGSPSGCTQLNT